MAIDQTDCDCFGMAILSHGENGRISTRDGSITLENLIRKVKKCESLLGKPKLIFVQVNLYNSFQSFMICFMRPCL